MHNFEPENLKNLTCVAHQECWVTPWGRKKDRAEGPQSHQTQHWLHEPHGSNIGGWARAPRAPWSRRHCSDVATRGLSRDLSRGVFKCTLAQLVAGSSVWQVHQFQSVTNATVSSHLTMCKLCRPWYNV